MRPLASASGFLLRVVPVLVGMRCSRAVLLLAAAIAFGAETSSLQMKAAAQNVTTEQYNNQRTGVQSEETLLTPANVTESSFGKLFTLPVSGHVYAEPLYMAGLTMADGTVHNVLFVATEQDDVYAFDADGHNPKQGYLWKDELLGSGETWVTSADVSSGNIYPDIGITGTPVIDPESGTLYVVAVSKTTTGTVQFFSRLHALRLTDGSETLNGPTTIEATVPGTGDGGSTVSFNPLLGNQRPALLLASTPNGNSAASVFITWASHGDNGPYHGWVISYNAADISQQTGAWCDTPNGLRGGIWMPGSGLSSDDNGNIFGASGNGSFDGNTGGSDFGDTAFSLSINGSALSANTWFTPSEQGTLNAKDLDMGSSGMILLPTQSGPNPRLAVNVDKSGTLFLLDRDNLGGYTYPNEASLQSFSVGYEVRDSFAFFNNMLYLAGESGPLVAYTLDPQTDRFVTTPAMQSAITFGCAKCASGGSTPTISANGTSDAIVWALDVHEREVGPAILRAFDASDITNEIYDSTQAPNGRDTAVTAIAFTSAMVANGHVFVGGVNGVTVYGELNGGVAVTLSANPTSIPSGGSSMLTVTAADATQVTVTGDDGSSYTMGAQGGTQSVSPSVTTTYTATAIGTGGQATATAKVSVGVPSVSISATPMSISPGGSSILSVTATNATAVTISGSDGSSYTLPTGGGTQSVAPTTTTIYTATATGTGGKVSTSVTVTVASSQGGCLPSAPGAVICQPASGSSAASPVTVAAGAVASGGDIAAIRIYIDNVSMATVNNPSRSTSFQINQAVTTSTGNHRLVIVAYQTNGGVQVASEYFSATGGTQAATVTISANPTAITAGASSMLNVTATNATGVTVTGSDGSKFTLGPTGGSHAVTPASTTTYTATAAGATGNVTSSVTVTVGSAGGCLPSAPGAMICQPASGSSAASPVTVSAGAVASGGDIAAIRIYIDNVSMATVNNPSRSTSFQINQAVTTSTGNHRLVIVAYQTNGGVQVASEYFSATGGTQAATVTISANPTAITAGGSSMLNVTATNATGVTVTGSDGSKFTLGPTGGSHAVTPASTTTYTATAAGATGNVTSSVTVTVGSAGGCLPSAPGAVICQPASGSSAASPVTVSAGAVASGGDIAAIRIYIDNVSMATVNNPSRSTSFQINQAVTTSTGNHRLVIVAYQTNGGVQVASEYFTTP